MRTLVWAIGLVLFVDLAIVAWFALRRLVGRRRARRAVLRLGVERPDVVPRLAAVPEVPQLRPVEPSARWRRSGGSVGATVVTFERPIPIAGPTARRASLAAFVAATAALIVVLALDPGVRPARREGALGASSDPTSLFEPTVPSSGSGSLADDVRSPAGGAAVPPPVSPADPTAGGGSGGAPAPERVAADPRSPDEILLAWAAVPEATAYVIERWDALQASPGWVVIGEIEADATTYVDGQLEPGTTYYYRVSAVTEDGSAPSDVVSATTLPGPPDAPVIVATADGDTVTLAWADVGGETGYLIERTVGDGDAWATIATVGQDVTLYVDGGLEEGVTYGYRVIATNEAGGSAPSNVASATTADDGASTGEGGSDDVDTGGPGGAASVEADPVAEPSSPELSGDDSSAGVTDPAASDLEPTDAAGEPDPAIPATTDPVTEDPAAASAPAS